MSWYVSRPVPLWDGDYFVVEGTDPWNRHALEPGVLGEHARWWLKLQQKHQRLPWWRIDFPEQITGVRTIRVSWVDRLLARLLVAWIAWRLARPW